MGVRETVDTGSPAPSHLSSTPPGQPLRFAAAPFSPVRESKVTIKIPRPLYRKIQQVVEESGFDSPTDFIVYVLRDLMGEAEAQAQAAAAAAAVATAKEGGAQEGPEFTQEELDDVKRKLRNLGYL